MFSIVIPLYNKESTIQNTLKSVFAQTFNEYEVIVVDDGSTDNSAERVMEMKNDRIRMFRKQNGGSASARNKGIEEATFPYIAFLDADDFWDSEYLSEQNLLINDFPDAAMWGFAYGRIYNGEKMLVDHVLPLGYRNYVTDFFGMSRKTDLFHTSSLVVAKRTFEKIGLFDTRIKGTEDTDLWFRIISMMPVVFCNRTYGYHNLDAENRIMMKRPLLKEHFSYYIDKYNKSGSTDQNFLNFINEYAAIKLLYYYFDTSAERNEALAASKNLDFSKIKVKYKLFYKTPFFIGYTFYQAINLKKWLLSKNVRERAKLNRTIEGTPI